MSTTPNRAIPYPALGSAPDVTADLAAIALKVDDDLNTLFTRVNPGQMLARLIRTSTGTIVNQGSIPFDAVTPTPNLGWSSSAPTRFTPWLTGWHHIGGHVHHGATTSGLLVSGAVKKTGVVASTVSVAANSSPSGGTSIPLDEMVYLTFGSDYLEITIGNANAAAASAAGTIVLISYAGL
jgi:hypothetical protein